MVKRLSAGNSLYHAIEIGVIFNEAFYLLKLELRTENCLGIVTNRRRLPHFHIKSQGSLYACFTQPVAVRAAREQRCRKMISLSVT